MGKLSRPDGGANAAFLPLLSGGSGRSTLSRQRGWRWAVGRRPICVYQGKRNAWAGRPFREVLALPSRRRPVGAVSALGIDRSGAGPENLTGTRLCTDSELCAGDLE